MICDRTAKLNALEAQKHARIFTPKADLKHIPSSDIKTRRPHSINVLEPSFIMISPIWFLLIFCLEPTHWNWHTHTCKSNLVCAHTSRSVCVRWSQAALLCYINCKPHFLTKRSHWLKIGWDESLNLCLTHTHTCKHTCKHTSVIQMTPPPTHPHPNHRQPPSTPPTHLCRCIRWFFSTRWEMIGLLREDLRYVQMCTCLQVYYRPSSSDFSGKRFKTRWNVWEQKKNAKR